MTSHAAVVARGMGTCCVAGCGELTINEDETSLEEVVNHMRKLYDVTDLHVQ